jgi:hypothetical protein
MIDYPMEVVMVTQDAFDVFVTLEEDLGDFLLNINEDIEVEV